MLASAPEDLAAFRDARFGMFIHWGLYAQLGGRWKGEKMEYIGEWAQSRFRIPSAEYAKLAGVFNPVKYDADAWVREAKAAGMAYMVLTAKHHEGFAMYATKASPFNVVDATPFKRDVYGELVAACRRHGMKVGFYYSQNIDWHEFDAADPVAKRGTNRGNMATYGMDWGNSWDWPDATHKDLNRYLKAKVYPQLRELLTNYGDIFVIWFDTPLDMTAEQSREIREFVRSIQPHTLVNSRIGNGFGDFGSLGDNQLVSGRAAMAIECPMTLNDTWGFKYDDHNWKSAYTVACNLMQSISCDANMLLNIGPRPDGRFPDASSDVLAELAAWRAKTGVQFRGAGPSPFAQAMPWGWCTVAKDGALQFAVKSDWTNDLEVCGIRNEIASCSAPFEKDGGVLRVKLAPPDDAMPRVVIVRLVGKADIDTRTMPQNGGLELIPSVGGKVTAGAEDGKETCKVTDHGSFTYAHHPGDAIRWKVYFPRAGRYAASVVTECWAHSQPWAEDRRLAVSVGDSVAEADLKKDIPLPHTVYDRAESKIGTIEVPAAGEYDVTVRTVSAGEKSKRQDINTLILKEE